jgi:hypothetical protein
MVNTSSFGLVPAASSKASNIPAFPPESSANRSCNLASEFLRYSMNAAHPKALSRTRPSTSEADVDGKKPQAGNSVLPA